MATKKPKHSGRKTKNKDDLIAGVLTVSLILVGTVGFLFKDKISDFFNKTNLSETADEESSTGSTSSSKYGCIVVQSNEFAELNEKAIKDCDGEGDVITISYEGVEVAKISKQKLINSCETEYCKDKKVEYIGEDYIVDEEDISKSIYLIFSSTPSEENINKLVEPLLSPGFLSVNDKIILKGADSASLSLTYEFFPLKATIFNNNRDSNKLVQLSFSNEDISAEAAEYEFGLTEEKKENFKNSTELKDKLNEYLTNASFTSEIGLEDFLNKGVSVLGEGTTQVNTSAIYIFDQNVKDPTVRSSNGSIEYSLDQKSCQTWHNIAYNHNLQVSQCQSKGEEGVNCGVKYKTSYYTYFFGRYKNVVDVGKLIPEVNFYKLDFRSKEEMSDLSCKEEITAIYNKLLPYDEL